MIKYIRNSHIEINDGNLMFIITYDKNNVPTNLKENHGIGTQSIISFCKSNKLTLDYDITENYFTLSILF